MAPKTTPPRSGGVGSLPPSGNPKVAAPSVVATPSVIKFDDDVKGRRNVARRQNGNATKPNKKRNGGFFSWLISLGIRLSALYLLVGAFWTCPSHPLRFDYNPKDSRSHCRALAHGKAHLQPVVAPYIAAAQAKVEPYTKPYVDAASPYAKAAWKTSKPYYRYANKQAKWAYNRHVEPTRKLAVKKGRLYVDPHVKKARQFVDSYTGPVAKAMKPWKQVYHRDVAPYLNEAYVQSLAFGSASYGAYVSHVHPLVVRSLRETQSFYVNHFDPAIRRAYALYIRPQMDKVLAKMFGHKAQAAGSDALKAAKQGAKQVRKDAKVAEKEKVAEAKASAIRAQEDPTLIDRLNKARDHVVGGPLAAADPVASAAADAELAVEAESTKEQLEEWEKNLAKLIEHEYSLVVGRFGEVRTRFAESLPERFEVLTEDVEIEVEGVFARLAKSLKNGDSASALEKQRAKLQRSRRKALDNLDGLYDQLQREEYEAQRASVTQVERYIVEAQKAYLKVLKNARFEQTRRDWKDWDSGMGVRSQLFDEELTGVRTGTTKVAKGVVGVDAGQEGDIQREMSRLHKQVEALYDTAEKELEAFAAGEAAKQNGDNDDVGANLISILSSKASTASASWSSVAAAATDAPSSAASALSSASPSSDSGSVADILGDAAGEAAAFTDAVKTGLSDFGTAASSSASSLARQASSSVGLKPTPESLGEHVEAAAGIVKDAMPAVGIVGAAQVFDDASSAVRKATRSAASLAGAQVTAETPEDYLESAREVLDQAGSSASLMAQQVYGAMGGEGASEYLHEATRSAASLVGVKPTPETVSEYVKAAGEYVEAASSSLASAASSILDGVSVPDGLHEATRSAASLVGAKPTPESVSEYLEAAGDFVEAATSSVVSAASVASSAVASGAAAPNGGAASSLVDAATSSAASLVGEASSVAHQASRSVVSAVGGTPEPEGIVEHVQSVVERVGHVEL